MSLFGAIFCIIAYYQDGSLDLVANGIDRGAENQILKAAVPMSAHHQQVGTDRFCEPNEFPRGVLEWRTTASASIPCNRNASTMLSRSPGRARLRRWKIRGHTPGWLRPPDVEKESFAECVRRELSHVLKPPGRARNDRAAPGCADTEGA